MSEIQDEDMKLYPCSNCGDYYPYCGIENHLESCLLENIVEDCKFCGETVVKKLIEQHQQNCQAFALQEKEDDVCEFCQEKIFKQFKQDHYSDCALKQIADTYQFYTAHECPICLIDIGPMDQKEFSNVAIYSIKIVYKHGKKSRMPSLQIQLKLYIFYL